MNKQVLKILCVLLVSVGFYIFTSTEAEASTGDIDIETYVNLDGLRTNETAVNGVVFVVFTPLQSDLYNKPYNSRGSEPGLYIVGSTDSKGREGRASVYSGTGNPQCGGNTDINPNVCNMQIYGNQYRGIKVGGIPINYQGIYGTSFHNSTACIHSSKTITGEGSGSDSFGVSGYLGGIQCATAIYDQCNISRSSSELYRFVPYMPSGWGDAFASNLAMGYTNADPKGGGAFYAGSKAGTRGDRNVENFNHVNFAGSTTPYYGNDDHPYYRIGNTLYKFLPGESFDDVSGEQKLGSESRFLHKDDEVSNGISKDLEFYWIPPQGNVCGEIYEPSLGECPAGTSYDSNVNRCTKQSCKLDPSSTSDDYICVQDDGTAGDATQRFCGNTTVQCGNSCVDINGTPTCNPGTVCTASNICAKPTCVDGDCIGTGTNANFCGEPPIPPNHYIMTTGGDVYIGDNISSDLRDAFSRAENISIGTNPFNNNPRLNTISDSLQNKRPYISSNLLFTNSTNAWTLDKSLGSVIKATLPLNTNTIPFIDRSSTEYTGSSSSSNPRLDNSFYHYYLPKFASSLETVVNNSLSISPGDVTLRQLFAPSENPAENDIKKIISITDTSAVLDRLTLSGNTTLVCNSKTIFLIKGNLAITTDIINQDPDDSCIFIIEGHLTIALAQRASISSNTSYRILEGMFMADSVSTVGGNSERGLILNGSILTNESSASNPDSAYQNYPGNNHNIKTDDYWQRPQELYIYDPRHLSIWSEQLSGSGSFSAIRETRFLNITD